METNCTERNGTLIGQSPNWVFGTDTDRRFLETIREGITGSDHLLFSFRGQYLLNSICKKYTAPTIEAAKLRRDAAVAKLLATEQRNRETQWRLRNVRAYSNIMQCAQQIIYKVLGDYDVREMYLESDFSGGASISRKREVASPEQKFDPQSAVTHGALPFYYEYLGWHPANFVGPIKISIGNVLFTVPKSSDIDRVACKEPDWNMFFQKGLGSMIRKRLKRVGIDLNDQSINRNLAQSAVNADLCTIDLSSASDSITEELVYQLFPRDWYNTIVALRSPIGIQPVTWFDLPKPYSQLNSNERRMVDKARMRPWCLISTMGNGFTFELESLIFYALVKAVVTVNAIPGKVSVYGDDIICPRNAYDTVKAVFSHVGFILNEDKSFKDGSFFESCGGHYFNGNDVTPFYLRGPLDDDYEAIINFVNQFRKWATGSMHNGPGTHIADPALYETWRKLVDLAEPIVKKGIIGQDHENSTACIYSYGKKPRYRFARKYAKRRRIDGILSYWYFFAKSLRTHRQGDSEKFKKKILYHDVRSMSINFPIAADNHPIEDGMLIDIKAYTLKRRKFSRTALYFSEQQPQNYFPQEVVVTEDEITNI